MRTFAVKPKILKRSIEDEKVKEKQKSKEKQTKNEEKDIFSIDDSLSVEIGTSYFEKKLEKVSSKIKSDPNYLKGVKPVIRKPKIIPKTVSVNQDSQDSINSQQTEEKLKNAKSESPKISPVPPKSEILKKKVKNQPQKRQKVSKQEDVVIEMTPEEEYSIEDVFNIESSEKDVTNEDTSDGIGNLIKKVKQKKKRKIKTSIKSSMELKNLGQEQNQRDNIYYCLDGLKDKNLDVKCSSLNDFLSFMKDSEFNLFLRAHGMMKLVLTSLMNISKYNVLKDSSIKILCILLKDPLNGEYLDEKCLEIFYLFFKEFLEKEYNNTRSLILETIQIQFKHIESKFLNMKFNELIKEYLQHLSRNISKNVNYVKDLTNCLMVLNQYELENLLDFLFYFKDFDLNNECVILILKHLTNMTNYNDEICEKFPLKKGIDIIVEMVYFNNFDLQVLCLGLLINLSEKNQKNRSQISNVEIKGKKFISHLIELFQNDIENNEIDKNIHKSYVGVLLGCLSKDNDENLKLIQKELKDFNSIIDILKEFIHFQSNIKVLTKETLVSLNEIINFLKEK